MEKRKKIEDRRKSAEKKHKRSRCFCVGERQRERETEHDRTVRMKGLSR